ncbi:CdaR family transcriptional regulator [Conexibacter sp. W3-3-2]|uniref:PucR family transcriptional regulator n=1 Tax=Conexibacter sp. W3-3-2 TaxID=2675227 RepID=UPI0018AC2868|nr:helix-turn-helix domain-containing protein [Conexibacter sp. W3-3-2]
MRTVPATDDRQELAEPARAAISASAADLAARIEEVRELVDERIVGSVADLAVGGDELFENLAASTRAHMVLISGMLGAWADPREAHPPPESVRWARDFLRVGVPVDRLMRSYRLGHAAFWAWWQERLREHADDVDVLAEAIAATSAWTFAYVDAVLQPLIDDHVEQQSRAGARAESVRIAEVRALLDRSAPAPDPDRAGARLRYLLRRGHVAFVAVAVPGADGRDPDPQTALERLPRTLVEQLALPEPPLVVPAAGDAVHGWIGGRALPAPADLAALRLPGVVLAFGGAGDGLDGFRDSHEEAREAARVARLCGRRPGSTVTYRDTAVLALLTADGDRARRFAGDVLGALADDSDGSRRLLATLAVFQEEQLSFARTARRLGVHQNTIAYRVRRCLELCGEEDAGSLRLRAAVALVATLRDR